MVINYPDQFIINYETTSFNTTFEFDEGYWWALFKFTFQISYASI